MKQALAGNFKPAYDTFVDYLTHGIFNIILVVVGCATLISALFGLLSKQRDILSISVACAAMLAFAFILFTTQVAYFAFSAYALTAIFLYVVFKRTVYAAKTVASALIMLTLITLPFIPRVTRELYARVYYASASKTAEAVVNQIFREHKDIKYAIAGTGQYLLLRPFVPVFDAGLCDSLVQHLKQNNAIQVLYADSTDYIPKSFINRLLLRPTSDIKVRRISKVGEYLLVE